MNNSPFINICIFKVVALIGGAHRLGGAMPKNSGYKGKWEPKDRTFDNRFIQTIAKGVPWTAVVCIKIIFQSYDKF